MISIGGWVVATAVIGGALLIKFWNNIKNWLNNTAANAVERVLGYGARERMHRAVATIDKAMNKIRNRTVIYTKKNNLDTHFHKTTLEAEASIYPIDEGILKEIEKKKVLVQEFGYQG